LSLFATSQRSAALHRQQQQSQIPRSFVLPITSARHADLPCIRSYLASAVAGFPPHSARRQAILLARLLTGASSPAHQLLSLLSLTSALQEQPAVARPRRAPIAVGIQRHRRHLHPAALAVHTTTIALSSTAAGGRARFACPTPPHDTITRSASAAPRQCSLPPPQPQHPSAAALTVPRSTTARHIDSRISAPR
jgi:hypothetical protein